MMAGSSCWAARCPKPGAAVPWKLSAVGPDKTPRESLRSQLCAMLWLVPAGTTKGHLSLLLLHNLGCIYSGSGRTAEQRSSAPLGEQRTLWHVSAWGVTSHSSKTALRQVCGGSLYGRKHTWMVVCTLFTPLLSLLGQLRSIRKQN